MQGEKDKPAKLRLKKLLWRFLVVCLVLIIALEGLMYFRPLPTLQPTLSLKSSSAPAVVNLPWPGFGQEAIGAEGFGVLETHGQQKPAPIASVAKIMTAYSVLKQKPLASGQQGPLITVSDQDVVTYNDYVSKGGSVAKVVAGEQISEYQALQAMLLPSANNFADLLANWAFGTTDHYIVFANGQAKQIGLSETHIADPSGFSPQTLSSAQDLVTLGEEAIKNPVVADIVSQQQANIPVAGIVHNVNWLLGTNGINGIKTGNTDQAGGCFLVSSKIVVSGQPLTIVGAVVGAPTLEQAVSASAPLAQAVAGGFKMQTAGQQIGYYQIPWDGQVPAVAKQDLKLLVWQDQKVSVNTKLNALRAPLPKGTNAGTVTASTGQKNVSTQVILSQNIPLPTWRWRIFER
jgi:serine-type D-Ala-D-Ala carboxypeptidase (penicillin-binding protein 5/6)